VILKSIDNSGPFSACENTYLGESFKRFTLIMLYQGLKFSVRNGAVLAIGIFSRYRKSYEQGSKFMERIQMNRRSDPILEHFQNYEPCLSAPVKIFVTSFEKHFGKLVGVPSGLFVVSFYDSKCSKALK